MKNLTILVLAVLLGAAIISGFVFYEKYGDVKDALEDSNRQLLVRNETLAQLNEERTALYGKIQKNAGQLEELENANLRISQLEDGIKVKDQALSRSHEKIRQMEEELKEAKKIEEAIRKQLSLRHDTITGLEEQLQEEASLGKVEIEELRSTYTSLISELKRQLIDKEMTIREFEEMLTITFVDRVLFDFGQATITSKGRKVLAEVGKALRNAQGMKIRVVGHTDNVPIRREYRYRFPSNWDLSSARAAAVVRYFQREGDLDPQSLEAVGRSFYEPVATNETEEGRAQNRRVEVIIAPMMGRQ